jgi:hypothetical protein
VRHLYSNAQIRAKVGRAKDGGHAAFRDTFVKAVVVHLLSDLKRPHVQSL